MDTRAFVAMPEATNHAEPLVGLAILKAAARELAKGLSKGDWCHQNLHSAFGDKLDNVTLKTVAGCQSQVIEKLAEHIDDGDIERLVQWALSQRVGSVVEAQGVIVLTTMSSSPAFEFQIAPGSRWYPGSLTASTYRSPSFGTVCRITVNYNVCDIESQHYLVIHEKSFTTEGVQTDMSVGECLQQFGLRPISQETTDGYMDACGEAMRVNSKVGQLVEVSGLGYYKIRGFMGGIGSMVIGTDSCPAMACVDPALESDTWENPQLPFVRLFDLVQKRYMCVDVRDVKPHVYDKTITERLCLPKEIEAPVSKVFAAPPDTMFGDLMRGRHGGMVVLASGPSGVGKTFTAEAYAESAERPLYVMGLGELGTNLKEVEESLKQIFERAARWNAVLLFDEAEIFLAKRDMNLERSAIVGVFLRLLDYYRGMFFMTTNRPDVIDDAFRSRITLHLKYPELSQNSRLKIWSNMLKAAGLELVGEEYDNSLVLADKMKINGRQIRNVCRLGRMMHPTGKLTIEDLTKLVELSTK